MRRGQGAEDNSCCSLSDSHDARAVAELLGINFYVLNFEAEFAGLRDYFCRTYLAGETPNPCVVCNSDLKFGKLLRQARALGADAVATGHYARLVPDPRAAGGVLVGKGADPEKDQSYFLFSVPAETLPRVLFPVGHLAKPEVRALAREAGLPVKDKKESSGFCFDLAGDYRCLLQEGEGGAATSARPGLLLDPRGKVLGEHAGVHNFTVGQRKGLGVSGTKQPLYVVRLDPARNTVVLGEWEDLRASACFLRDTRWHVPVREGETFACRVRTRYRLPEEPASVTVLPGNRSRVDFDPPTYGLAPGQAAVCYDGSLVLGGGWIEPEARPQG